MRVLIRDMFKTVSINIYGIDGNEHTNEFFEKYLSSSKKIQRTPDDEKRLYCSDAEWTIIRIEDFEKLKEIIATVQKAIDDIGNMLIDGETADAFTFSDECYLI